MIQWLGQVDPATDLIVLPEYANCPGASTRAEMATAVREMTAPLLAAVREAAVRCGALACANLVCREGDVYRNVSHLFDGYGALLAAYCKTHLTGFESNVLGLSEGDTLACNPLEPVFSHGVGYNMITCYDVYFPEFLQRVASQNAHVILHPSYQRGEASETIVMLSRARAFDMSAFLVRASYSMGEGRATGGHSLVAAPDGSVLGDIGQAVGLLYVDIPEVYRYMRPSEFQGEPVELKRMWNEARKPWQYRAGGPLYRLPDARMPYPRVCAHRGFPVLLPENALISFGAAIALGAQEIELDLWPSKDGRLIVCHDRSIDRVAEHQAGQVMALTYDEIMRADIGVKRSPLLKGLRIATFEEVLAKFAHQAIVNIHIKSPDVEKPYSRDVFRRIVEIIDQYECRGHVYFAGERDVLETALDVAPDIARCCLEGQQDYTLIENAVRYECRKVQFFKPYITQDMIDRAHAHGIRCNVFWADEPEEARQFLAMGMDTILTNDCMQVLPAVHEAAPTPSGGK